MSKTATIINENGIHARPASVIVKKAKEFKAGGTLITLTHNDKTSKADSLIQILGLSLKKDSEVIINAEGPDAEKAINEMAELISALVD